MWRCITNEFGVQHFKYLERICSLVISTLRCVSGGIFKTGKQIFLGNSLHIASPRKSSSIKIPPKISLQALVIRQKPCFHALNHQMCLVIVHTSGPSPSIFPPKMVPTRDVRLDGALSVNQQNYKIVTSRLLKSCAEKFISARSGPHWKNAQQPYLHVSLLKKGFESFFEISLLT